MYCLALSKRRTILFREAPLFFLVLPISRHLVTCFREAGLGKLRLHIVGPSGFAVFAVFVWT